MTSTTEEFAMPMDLSPEHAAPEIASPPWSKQQEASQEVATLETLDGPGPDGEPEASETPEHEQWKDHNGIMYVGLVPPDFARIEIVSEIEDETCLAEPLEPEVVFAVIKFDGNDSTVAIRPGGCKTHDGLYWLNPDEYEVVSEGDQAPPDATEETVDEYIPGEVVNVSSSLTRSQQLRFKHHEQIIRKQMAVDNLLEAWEETKKDAKTAKECYESAVEALQRLIRTPPSQLSLFEGPQETASTDDDQDDESDQNDSEDESTETQEDGQGDQGAASDAFNETVVIDSEAWRMTSLEELIVYGLSDAVVKKFAEGGVHTLGDACDFQMGERGRPLTDIKGIGQAKVDKFEEASMAWHRDHPIPSGEVVTEEVAEEESTATEVDDQAILLSSLLDHEFTQEVCNRFEAAGVTTIDHAEYVTHEGAQDENITPSDYVILERVISGHKLREAEQA